MPQSLPGRPSKQAPRPHLEKADDRDLVVGDQSLGLRDLGQHGGGGAGALLQPVDDVISGPASCRGEDNEHM